MHVFSDVLYSHTSPSILSIHFSWKAQHDISWFPLLAGGDSRNFMTKTSAINTVLVAWGLKIDIKSSYISCWYTSYLNSGGTLYFLNQNLTCNSLRGTLSSLCPHIRKVHQFLPKRTAGFFVQQHQTQHVSNTAFIKTYVITTFNTSLSRTKQYVPQQVTHANNSYFIFGGYITREDWI